MEQDRKRKAKTGNVCNSHIRLLFFGDVSHTWRFFLRISAGSTGVRMRYCKAKLLTCLLFFWERGLAYFYNAVSAAQDSEGDSKHHLSFEAFLLY